MKTFVMIPTYNEKENIKNLIDEILRLKIDNLHIVVVDDFSPDGTWKIVEDISKKNNNVHLLLRKTKRGRGYAGKECFNYCLNNGADIIIEMDADFSHDPKYLPKMLEEIKDADVVIGSRFVKDAGEQGRGLIRRIITKLANFYIRLMLGIKIKDCNSGFRCFRRKVLETIDVDKIKAKGPDILQETLYKANAKGFRIKETPIVFVNRKSGSSKLGIKHLIRGYFMILKLRFGFIK